MKTGQNGGRNLRAGRPLPTRDSTVAAALLGIGAGLLVAAAFTGWYTVDTTVAAGQCHQIEETLYLDWVGVTQSGNCYVNDGVGTYQAAGLLATGGLYLALLFLVAVAVVLAAGLSTLVLVGSSRRQSRLFLVVGVIAVAAAGLGPALLVLEQPAAICSDQGFKQTPLGAGVEGGPPANQSPSPVANPGPACNGWSYFAPGGGNSATWMSDSGPWNSFAGGASLPGAASMWAPSLGWYLAVVSVGSIGGGTCLGLFGTTTLARREGLGRRTPQR